MQHELVHEAGVDALANDLAATHHEHVLVAGDGPGLLDGGGQVALESEVQLEAHVGGRLVGDDEERRPGGVLRAVAHLVAPAARRVDHVEQVAAHHHGAGALGRVGEDLSVDGVVALEDPRVQRLAARAEPVVRAGVGASYEAIEGDGDVGDHDRHGRSSSGRLSGGRAAMRQLIGCGDQLAGDEFGTAVSSTWGRIATRKRKTPWASSS